MTRTALAFCLSGAALLVGCDQIGSTFQSAPITTTSIEGKVRGSRSGGEQVRVWRDPDTGCQYLLWDGRRRGSMTPRLTAEGRPMCKPG